MFIKSLVTQETCLKTADSINKLKELPVVMYGAGVSAISLSNFLKRHFSLNIAAYFVDEAYINHAHRVENVMKIEQIKEKFKKFNIIIGFDTNHWFIKEKLEKLNCSQVNTISICDHSLWQSFELLDLNYIQKNQQVFQQVYDFFSDDKSKQIFVGYINTKLTLDLSYLRGLTSFPQYFPDDLPSFIPSSNEIFIDGGAYDGDTLKSFLLKTDSCQKYCAFEPDSSNYEKLATFVSQNNLAFVETIQSGLWNCEDVLYFQGNDGTSSAISQTGQIKINVRSIDSLELAVTFIKMDIEGAELEALKGASETIRKYKPKLAISLYHHPQHLTEIPLFIKSLYPEYKFYLRIHSFYSRELILYAIARD